MEVEQVGFDCEGVCAEGGAVADVGDGIEGLAGGTCADGQRGDVDAVGREKFGIGCEIDGGDGVAGAVAASGGWGGCDGKGATEKGACVADVALGEKRTDAAGGDRLAAKAVWGVDADFEVQLMTKSFEAFDVGFGLVTEAEVFAFVKLGDVEGLLEDFGGEGAGGLAREVGGEGKDEESVEAGGFEERELLREGCD